MKTPNTLIKKPITNKKLSGFTLVELIVVITILVILGTIAFTSLGGYSGSARDSSRVSDLTNLSKALNITFIKTGSYPDPENFSTITYSGGTLWKQGTIGESTINILSAGGGMKMSKKPTDPLVTSKEYTYSRTLYGNFYQIKSDWEGESAVYRNYLINKANAAPGNPTLTYIKSNYNGMVVKTESGGIKYLVTVPSLFLNTSSGTVVLPVNTQTGFYIQGQTNSGGILFTPKLVFSSGSLPSNDVERIIFASGIANAYSGTILATNSNIQPFINALKNTNTGALASLGGGVVGSLEGSASSGGNQTLPIISSWTVGGGGDCTAVFNTDGTSNGTTSTCTDNRTYTHMDILANHDRTYSLLKIVGVWWFNENIAYPPSTGYKGNGTWSGVDARYYSCPGNITNSNIDCSAVSTLGYLYQWSTAMSGALSNNNQSARTQGICPNGWGLPTKTDFTTTSDGYWPDAGHEGGSYYGNPIGWIRIYAGARSNDTGGTFINRLIDEGAWSSFENSSNAWGEYFDTGYPTQSARNHNSKAFGLSVRCIKN